MVPADDAAATFIRNFAASPPASARHSPARRQGAVCSFPRMRSVALPGAAPDNGRAVDRLIGAANVNHEHRSNPCCSLSTESMKYPSASCRSPPAHAAANAGLSRSAERRVRRIGAQSSADAGLGVGACASDSGCLATRRWQQHTHLADGDHPDGRMLGFPRGWRVCSSGTNRSANVTPATVVEALRSVHRRRRHEARVGDNAIASGSVGRAWRARWFRRRRPPRALPAPPADGSRLASRNVFCRTLPQCSGCGLAAFAGFDEGWTVLRRISSRCCASARSPRARSAAVADQPLRDLGVFFNPSRMSCDDRGPSRPHGPNGRLAEPLFGLASALAARKCVLDRSIGIAVVKE